MKKSIKIFFGILLAILFISCGSSNESMVEKYLPGTYTRNNRVEGEPDFESYFKELKIEHLKGNEYRLICIGKDEWSSKYDDNLGRRIDTLEPGTPDIFDFEISSIELEQKSDSISEYYIRGFVTNIVENGTTISYAESGINYKGAITLVIGKNTVEAKVAGKTLSSVREK